MPLNPACISGAEDGKRLERGTELHDLLDPYAGHSSFQVRIVGRQALREALKSHRRLTVTAVATRPMHVKKSLAKIKINGAPRPMMMGTTRSL